MREGYLEELLFKVIDISENAIFILKKDDCQIIHGNSKAVEMFGKDIIGHNCFYDAKEIQITEDLLKQLHIGEEKVSMLYVEQLKQTVSLKLNDMQWKDCEEVIVCTVLNTNEYLLEKREKEVVEQIDYKKKLKFLLEFDPLTNISNANRFYKDVGYLLLANPEVDYAIISLDINKFKLINDIFGISVGDDVLRFIAQTFKENLPEDALICRRYSDVFFICISYTSREEIIEFINQLNVLLEDSRFSFDIHIKYGIYIITDRMLPINLMCDRANLAKQIVKDNVVSDYAFYDEQYRKEIIETKEIEADMITAIEEKQFKLYLQPKYNLTSGQICGAEVLVRWQHPIRGIMLPNEFIPLFERNGFILKLDEYIWDETCKIITKWREEGIHPVPLSVNISRYHIKNNNLVEAWKQLIEKYNIPPCYLKLEITETFFYDTEDLYEVLHKLQQMGFEVELDDFGSGYSSLNMLRQAPLNTIKIDKEFLDKKLSSDKGKTVIHHAIALAKDLKLGVIAEGVETKEHVEFLKSSSCDVAQGYFFAKPMPIKEFEDLYYN